ncbi:MAG: aldo/keto reductase, partial [Deltaproteobacteria bacterium]|nr:aldo/keto reductase [Deltaproteobacteria bacterium]
MTSITSYIKLANGHAMPRLGLGTWLLSGREAVATSLNAALEAGYRRVDTASAYENEAEIGRALKESAIPREELFLASKAWITEQGQAQALEACQRSLERLGVPYLDLYLLHWPVAKNSLVAWESLERLLEGGLVKAIGVSNFQKGHIEEVLKLGGTKPMVNQIELHPHLTQESLSGFCGRQGIVVEAYCPLARGRLKKNQALLKLARKHARTVAQVILRWHFQSGRCFVPKSSDPERVRENAGIFGFVLSPEEMTAIGKQNQNRSVL